MTKLLVFDLDMTLAPLGEGIGEEELKLFRHIDSFDIVPAGMDKANGLRFLMKVLKLSKEDVIAIGDGTNDYAMFAIAGYSIGVNVKEEHLVNVNCKSTKEMLKYINNFINIESFV